MSRKNRTTMLKIVVQCVLTSRSNPDAPHYCSTMLTDRITIFPVAKTPQNNSKS